MRDSAIIFFLIFLIILVLIKKTSGFGSSSAKTPWDFIQTPLPIDDIAPFYCDMIINQLEGKPCLSNVNNIITVFNPFLVNKLTPYTSETEVATMFATADSSGESSLTQRDKIILRITSHYGYIFKAELCGRDIPSCDIGNDGRVSWTDEILKQTGQDLVQNMIQVFKLAKAFGSKPDDTIDMVGIINPILPKNLKPFTGNADYFSRIRSKDDATAVWFMKFVMIGPLYLYWKAINVWKLDPEFSVDLIRPPAQDIYQVQQVQQASASAQAIQQVT